MSPEVTGPASLAPIACPYHPGLAAEDRLQDRILPDEDSDCERFNGNHNPSGYPQVRRRRRLVMVSHILWTDRYGEIRTGMNLYHTCGNRWCVNIEHMEERTPSEIATLTLTRTQDLDARFDLHWAESTDGHHRWTGKPQNGKLLFFTSNTTAVSARRYSWMRHHGRDVPTGYVIVCTCDDALCVNPQHLEPAIGSRSLSPEAQVRRYRIVHPDTDCQTWNRPKNRRTASRPDYQPPIGYVLIDGRRIPVRCYLWDQVHDTPLGKGRLLRTCDTPTCINPAHMRLCAPKKARK